MTDSQRDKDKDKCVYILYLQHISMQCWPLMHMGLGGGAVWCTDRSSPGTHWDWVAYPTFFSTSHCLEYTRSHTAQMQIQIQILALP